VYTRPPSFDRARSNFLCRRCAGGTEFNFVNDVPHFDTYLASEWKFAAIAAAAGAGLSVRPRGLHVDVNRRGMYTSVGIPGTGIYAVRHIRSAPPEEHPRVVGNAAGFVAGLVAAPVIILVLVVVGSSSR
jgi:hypothetical protein